MQSSTSTIIAICLAAVLLFIVPLATLTDRNDNVTQENIKLIVEEFVTEIRNSGKITRSSFEAFESKLYSSGNNEYNIEMEVKHLDENPGTKTAQTNYNKIGENVYYSEYTTQILKQIGVKINDEEVNPENDTLLLEEGDIIYVRVTNENRTAAQTLKSSLYGFSNVGEYVISANSSGMVTVNGTLNDLIEKPSIGDDSTEEPPEEDTTKSEYVVIYNANGGIGAPESQIKIHGQNLLLSDVIPTRIGYNFFGWAPNSVATEGIYQPGATYIKDSDIKLYAVWKLKTYTVAYNANGGTGAPDNQTKTYGIDLKLSDIKPERYGHDFLGWSTSQNGEVIYNPEDTYTENADIELYAVWKLKTYIITYEANGGIGAPAIQEKTHGIDMIITHIEPSREGYNFLGWSTNASDTEVQYKPNDPFSIDADTTLYAIWKIKTYTVVYDANGGTGAPESQTKTHGIDMPLSMIKPEREGYNFFGWSSGETKYQPGESFKENADTTLYAIWDLKTYTIAYDANGGSGAPESQTKTHGIDINIPAKEPQREGYNFLGWGLKANDTDAQYKPNEPFAIDADTTLYAIWKIKTYTVTYNPNGGTVTKTTQTVDYGTTITLPEPTRTGYTFTGWKDQDNNEVKSPYIVTKDITLTAQWNINKHTIIYESGTTDTVNNLPSKETKNYGETYTIVNTMPSREGYTFTGWKNSDKTYQAGDKITITSDIKLIAQWKIKTYTITYNINGDTEKIQSQTKTHGENLKISETRPEEEGHNFLGWATSKNGKVEYQPGDSYTKNEDVTLYAIWEIKTYTVTYNANGGTEAPASGTKTHGANFTITSDKPKREGHKFLGWGLSATDTDVDYLSGSLYKENKDIELFAVWQINTYTIRYELNGGTGEIASQTKKYGETIKLSETVPEFEGYNFKGWATSENGDVKYQPGNEYAENVDITLYAKWEIKTYTIKFDPNGAPRAPASQTKTHGVYLKIDRTITRDGYTFRGWATSKDGNIEYQTGDMYKEDKDITLYAKWTVNYLIVRYHKNNGTEVFEGAPVIPEGIEENDPNIVRVAKFEYDKQYSSGLHNYSTSGAGTYVGRTGYSPTGNWGTASTGGTLVSENASFTSGQALAEALGTTLINGSKDITVYAQWNINKHTVIYEANGGTVTPTSQTVNYGTTITLLTPTRTGYIFKGWKNLDATYQPGQEITITSDITFTAQWEAKTITVTFAKNDGSDSTATQTFTYGQTGNKFGYNTDGTAKWGTSGQFGKWDRTGYTLLGWAKSSSATSAQYSIYSDVTDNWINSNYPSITLYAVWTINQYTVTYEANGGTVSPTSTTVNYGTTVTLPTPTRTGYTFTGWKNGSNIYKAGVTFKVTGNITLTAQWKINQYTVTYDANGGTVSPTSQKVDYGTTIQLPTPTRTGYTFTGWKNGSNTYQAGASFKVTSNITLIAQWKTAQLILIGSGASSSDISNSSNWVLKDNVPNGTHEKASKSISTSGIKLTGGSGQVQDFLYATKPLPKGYKTMTISFKITKNSMNDGSAWVRLGKSANGDDVWKQWKEGTHTVTLDPNTTYYLSASMYSTYTPNASVEITSLILKP